MAPLAQSIALHACPARLQGSNMKFAHHLLAAVAVASAACYASPASDSSPSPTSAGSTPTDEDVGATPELVDSEHASALSDIGLPLNQSFATMFKKAESAKKVKPLMEAFAKSLGVECSFCHEAKVDAKGKPVLKNGRPELDFEVETEKMRVTEQMWDQWVAKLQFKGTGAPVFCDSCHQGQAEFLNRDEPDKLKHWMKKNFNERLETIDGDPLKCGTCHGEKFKGEFLDDWAKEKG